MENRATVTPEKSDTRSNGLNEILDKIDNVGDELKELRRLEQEENSEDEAMQGRYVALLREAAAREEPFSDELTLQLLARASQGQLLHI